MGKNTITTLLNILKFKEHVNPQSNYSKKRQKKSILLDMLISILSRQQNGNDPSYDVENYKYNQIWTNKQFHIIFRFSDITSAELNLSTT